ncbi:MAG TPA: protein translocase subunit SecF [Acidimicrobiales bacterium]|nr:protein translocase subunit SecF [Acidimicrobiales bacterium]
MRRRRSGGDGPDADVGAGAGAHAGAGAGAAASEGSFSVDDAARALMAERAPKGHGPLARLYRGETRFDFVGRRRLWFAASTMVIVAGIVSIVMRGGLNLGIEFKGGTEWTIAAPGVTQVEAVDAMRSAGLINPTVKLLGSGTKQTLNVQSDLNKLSPASQAAISKAVQRAMLKLTASHKPKASPRSGTSSRSAATSTSTSTTAAAKSAAAKSAAAAATTTVPAATASLGSAAPDRINITQVGPTWGSSVTNKATEALIIFFIVVAAYISIRFEPKMALAAFIAMIHDILVAVGVYSLFNFQVTPDTVVAILTILGYSLYDTVVVFDRVRDNTKGIGSSGRLTYTQLINLSMNQTLARSINTSMVAILPVLSVLIVGAQLLGATTLQDYGLALFVGLLSGAYSSIFIASPVLAMLKRGEPRWVAIERKLAGRSDRESFSAIDAATMSVQMSVAAGGQARTGGRGPVKRTGPIRPGSGTGGGSGTGTGTGTAVMDRPAGGPRVPPKPRKGKGKRKR